MKTIISIFLKELLELSRDKKALLFIILLPAIAMPVIMTIVVSTIKKNEQETRGRTLSYLATGIERRENLAAFLAEEKMELLAAPSETIALKEQIRSGLADFALVLESEEGRVVAKVLHNDASLSNRVFPRVKSGLEKFNKSEMNRRLANDGYSELERDDLMGSVIVRWDGVSTTQERIGEKVGRLLPYVFIILSFVGAAFIATDVGAGDKERGSLEATLLAPIARSQIVLGKFAAIFATGMTTATITILSMVGWFFWGSQEFRERVIDQLMQAYGIVDILSVYIMLIPMVAIFAAMLLAASVYAKNYKESQSLIAPMQMLAIVPAIFATLPGVELEGKWLFIPVANISLSIRELLKGSLSTGEFWIVFGSTSLAAVAFVAFCSYWFRREEVVFRS